MNDPNGMVYYAGEYHLFYQFNPQGDKWGHMSWAHAVSSDLMHWQQLPLALAEADNVMIFSGSAVVDWNNTSGFGTKGQPPLVAIYTGHHTDKPLQNQQLAFSNDKGRTWTKFGGNPVLDIGEKDFRDPKVFWHETTHQWIMVAAWPLQRKVRFYASSNLKTWTHLSDFGPAGATQGIWECPDLFPLNIEQSRDLKKWVLIVNLNPGGPAGGSGSQYFVGNFDGQRFVADSGPTNVTTASTLAGQQKVLADFEGPTYDAWKVEGHAFANGPSHANGVIGFQGGGYADSFGNGDADQGTLTSPPFAIDAPRLNFLIGGGAHPGKIGINLLVDGAVVRSATGNNSAQMEPVSWDVQDFLGKTGRIEIFDRYSGNDWGHIFVDHITLTDTAPKNGISPALWVDYGRDFYAGVTWSGIPDADGRRILLGWMSNWDYGQDVPTSPWRSAMTVPRSLALRDTPLGLRIVQKPVAELDQLHDGQPQIFAGGSFAEAAAWLASQKNVPPLVDMDIHFNDMPPGTLVSLKITTGDAEETVVECGGQPGKITLDRTHSGRSQFHVGFAGRQEAPLRLIDGRCHLRLLLDTSSLEVFAQDGEVVLTDLIFPTGSKRRLSLVSDGKKLPAVSEIKLFRLKSVWSSPNTIRDHSDQASSSQF